MKKLVWVLGAIAIAFVGIACETTASWDRAAAADCKSIEMQVDNQGKPTEIEYHIAPSEVPEAVQAAMRKLHPNARFTAAEHERHGRTTYWELTAKVNGFDVEAMFLPDGTLHSEEVQVAESSVPDAVKKAARAAFPNAKVTAWEEIRDGARKLTEYHVKLDSGGKHYKIAVSTDGMVTAKHREVEAEIEVPVGG